MTDAGAGRSELEALRAETRRLADLQEIRDLAPRYAYLVDSRNIDELIQLYTEDCPVGPGLRGREALRGGFHNVLGTVFTTSVHFIGNQFVDLHPENPDLATGVVYCKAEHEVGDKWVVATLQYHDKYRREAGRWRFYSRTMRLWYCVDVLERPTGPHKVTHQLSNTDLGRRDLPQMWPTWETFWQERAAALGQDPRENDLKE